MAKFTDLGSAKPDDPIYKEGPTFFAMPSFEKLGSSRKNKDGPQESSKPQEAQSEEAADQWKDEEERLDTIHVLKRRLQMLRRNGGPPGLIEKWSQQLKDMQSQSEST